MGIWFILKLKTEKLRLLYRVQEQLISPRFGGPIIGGLRDFITGAYLLTKDDTILTSQEFTNFAMLGGYKGKLPEPASKNKTGVFESYFSIALQKKEPDHEKQKAMYMRRFLRIPIFFDLILLVFPCISFLACIIFEPKT